MTVIADPCVLEGMRDVHVANVRPGRDAITHVSTLNPTAEPLGAGYSATARRAAGSWRSTRGTRTLGHNMSVSYQPKTMQVLSLLRYGGTRKN